MLLIFILSEIVGRNPTVWLKLDSDVSFDQTRGVGIFILSVFFCKGFVEKDFENIAGKGENAI